MSEPDTYKRGQIEWALWRAFSLHNDADPRHTGRPPKVFQNRIKRLLDLDVIGNRAVFADFRSGQRGEDVAYSGFHAFLAALALTLLDAGFKQGDVIFMLAHMKDQIREVHERIMKDPPAVRMRVSACSRPDLPKDTLDEQYADQGVYLVIQKFEMLECWSAPDASLPFILFPDFCWGLMDLAKRLGRISYQDRQALVIEIGEIAAHLDEKLRNAPAVTRGRGAEKPARCSTRENST